MIDNHTEIEEEVVVEEETITSKEIVVFNDDVNTFDWVIESLIEVCEHEMHQAEQCTYIVHYNGKCAVKKGTYDFLKPMCQGLLDRGLSAEIN